MKKIRSVLTASLLAAVVVRPLHAQIRYVDQYSGATAGDKIVACIGDPALTNGGTCDARNLSGAQSIPNKVTLHSGITLVLPPPTAANFTTSANPAFNVNNASDVTILNGQVTLSGVGASAVTYTGTVSNLRIEGMTVVGSGAVGDGQLGFWCGSGQTLSNIRILNNTISGVITGISMNADLGGSIKGFLISGNHLSNIVGTDSGQGYGIHHANGSGNSSDGRIVNNYIETAQRHSIYQAKGSGVTIMGNVVRDHRAGVAPTGQERPAIMISRSQNITVSGNVVENSLGGAFAVDTDTASYPVQNVVLANNIVRTTKDFYPITVGTSNPSQDSFPTDVTLIGNQIYQDAAVDNTFGGSLIQVFSGKRIQLVNNYLVLTNAQSNGSSLIQIRGSQEGAGTATYTDEITAKGNYFYGPGAAATYGVELYTTAATSGIHAYFSSNRVNLNGTAFVCDTSQTDPNLIVTDMPLTGLNASITQTHY